MIDYQTMMLMAQQIQREEEEEKEGRVTIPCYGCAHLCASPFECIHPNTVCVRYDPIYKRPYRLPSVELCYDKSGMCKFYEPHEEHGAEYIAAQKKMLRAKQEEYSRKFDDEVNKLSDGTASLDDFIQEIEELTKDLDDLEEVKSNGTKE